MQQLLGYGYEMGSYGADNVMIIISMVVSFYFGTQQEKAAN